VHVYGHPVLIAETFVDIGRFTGTCYKAANWQYLGQTSGYGKHSVNIRSTPLVKLCGEYFSEVSVQRIEPDIFDRDALLS
jgi:hypothetical protein